MKQKLYGNFFLKTFVKYFNTIFNNPVFCITRKLYIYENLHRFWYQLQVTDKSTFIKAITVERTHKKVEKCKLDISFVVKCRDGNLQPTFTRVKRFKGMNKKIQNRYYRRLLLDEISNKCNGLKLLNKQLEMETNILNDSSTWMKGIRYLLQH